MEFDVLIYKNKKQLSTEYRIMCFSDSDGTHVKYYKYYGIGCTKTIYPKNRPWHWTVWRK